MSNIEKYRKLLEKENVGLLLTSRYSRYYAARFDIAEGVAVITQKGCRYFTDSRYIEAAQGGIRDLEVVEMNRGNPYPQLINAAAREFGVDTWLCEEEYLTVQQWQHYEKNLEGALQPASQAINALRQIKQDWELELMRKAQDITDLAFAEVLTKIKTGMTEKQLQAELIYCLYKNGGEGLSFDPIVVSGPNTSMPHGVAGERVIQAGDFITMDFGAMYRGYCADMTRTVAVGYATEEMKKVYETVLGAQEAGLSVTRAGATGAQIDGAARQFIADAGYGAYFGHGYGHCIGMECHELPACSPRNEKPMEEGMVSSAEPGIYLPGKFGVRIEDVVIFKADGCENLTHSPKNLIIL